MAPLLLPDMRERAFCLPAPHREIRVCRGLVERGELGGCRAPIRARPGDRAALNRPPETTMNVEDSDQLLQAVLPPALEVLTAWSVAETEAAPSVFTRPWTGRSATPRSPWIRCEGWPRWCPDCRRCPESCSTSSPRSPAGPPAKSCTTSTSATSTPPSHPDMETYRGETGPENPDMSPCRDGCRRLIGRQIQCSYAIWFAASYLHYWRNWCMGVHRPRRTCSLDNGAHKCAGIVWATPNRSKLHKGSMDGYAAHS